MHLMSVLLSVTSVNILYIDKIIFSHMSSQYKFLIKEGLLLKHNVQPTTTTLLCFINY